MKNNHFFIILTVFLISSFTTLQAQNTVDYAVKVTADVNPATPSITLNWETDNYGTQYNIYRKLAGANGWGKSVATLSGNESTWTDNSVNVGTVYEYFLQEIGSGSFRGFGYIQSGIAVEPVEKEGTLLLVIESSLLTAMPDELQMLKMDLVTAGWQVVERFVSAADSVAYVKRVIDSVDANHDLESIYLFGHVPVPYSGNFCSPKYNIYPPDGHVAGSGDHCGCWAADVYYAVPEGNWTDVDSTVTGAARAANRNYAGDGKFDQVIIPGEVQYQLGRVDLWSMPAFGKTEVELLQQYVRKTHAFRNNMSPVYHRGLIDENFGANYGAFASTAWRDFTATVGPDNIEVKDYFTIMKDSTYLLGYGAGPGSYTSCGGIGKTTDFPANKAAMFNYLFGSFFGDWDINNNFLRAPLASDTGGLVNAWVGRPWWSTFPLGLGETIGYCTRISQNNSTEYGYYGLNTFRNSIHVALMGDPSLKLFNVTPASDLQLTPALDRKSVELSWTASTDPDVIGYHIYYSRQENGPYGRLNASMVTSTTFKHTWPDSGTNHYMVRAVKLQETPSGTYFNQSQGIYGKAENLIMGSVRPVAQLMDLLVYPNPARDEVFVHYEFRSNEDLDLTLTDLSGKVLRNTLHRDVNKGIISIPLTDLAPGIYILTANKEHRRIVVQ